MVKYYNFNPMQETIAETLKILIELWYTKEVQS